MGCSIWLAGAMVLAGPGLHGIAPCEHEAHHDSDPGNRLGESDACPVCSLLDQGISSPERLRFEAVAPQTDRVHFSFDPPPPEVPARSRLPRSPPRA
ncbi:hypothetical protein AB1L88_18365 [Tautonia sp. JC769]|uniref:hypothetical protein n=1 Tax=Tautonia sp. JC769 TaxID=3232135 RepID=UPI00345B00C3